MLALCVSRPQPLAKNDPEAVIRSFESGSAPATEQNVADYIKARAAHRVSASRVAPRPSARSCHALTRPRSPPARRWCTWTGWTKTR